MAWLTVIINLVAVFLNVGKTDAAGFAVASLLASIWALGIFMNFRRDPQSAPSYAVLLSTVTGVAGVVLIIIGLAS